MSKQCELTGTKPQHGNTVSHSNRKLRTRFLPNLQNVTLKSDALDKAFSLRITAATIRSIEHNGGLDGFLVTAKAHNLTELGAKIRRQIKKKLATTKVAAA